jgi:hypothetical protein
MQVVRDQAVTRALVEEGNEEDQEQPLAVSTSLNKDQPAALRLSGLEPERLADLTEFMLDETIILVTRSVVLYGSLVDFIINILQIGRSSPCPR